MTLQTEPARGYSIAFARDMIPEKMKPYSASLPPIYEKYQGKYLAIGGQGRGVDWLAGNWNDRMLMIGEFKSPQAVSDFWWGPEYRASAKLREGAVTVDVGQLTGTERSPGVEDTDILLIAMPDKEPMPVAGGKVLVQASLDDVTTLEGDLGGLSFTMAAYPSRSELDEAWAQVKDAVEAGQGYACAAKRAAA